MPRLTPWWVSSSQIFWYLLKGRFSVAIKWKISNLRYRFLSLSSLDSLLKAWARTALFLQEQHCMQMLNTSGIVRNIAYSHRVSSDNVLVIKFLLPWSLFVNSLHPLHLSWVTICFPPSLAWTVQPGDSLIITVKFVLPFLEGWILNMLFYGVTHFILHNRSSL